MNYMSLVAQVCDPNTKGYEYLTDFEFIKAFSCTYANQIGFLVTFTFIYGAVATSLFIRTGSMILPLILLLLVGGPILGMVLGPVVAIATILILVGGAGITTLVYQRYSR